MNQAKGISSKLAIARVSHCHFDFCRDLKREGFRYALIQGYWPGKAKMNLLEMRHPSNWLGVHIWLLLVDSYRNKDKNWSCQLLVKSWTFGSVCHWRYQFGFLQF